MSKNKAIFSAPSQPEAQVTLSNPVAEGFGRFIAYNAIAWQTRALVELENVLSPIEYKILEAEFFASPTGDAYSSKTFHDLVEPYVGNYVVQKAEAKGKHLVLCGAGPSLRDNIADWAPQADQIWGCNSAVTWLADNGYKPTHAITVDQTPHMYLEWENAPDDIEYLVATTINPALTDLLISRERRYRFFNNFVGMKGPDFTGEDTTGKTQTMSFEDFNYARLFPGTIQCGSGLNTLTRALDVAAYMDFAKITVLGADCYMRTRGKPRKSWALGSPPFVKWLKANTEFHVDGGHALASEATSAVLQATIDGRYWMTKPDLCISAQWLIRMSKASQGKIQIVGDGLPNALWDKDDAFWARMPRLTNKEGKTMAIPF